MSRIGPWFEMIENPADNDWVFDICNHLDSAAALLAGVDIDLEHAFEALSPRHRGTELNGCTGLVIRLATLGGVTCDRKRLLGANTPWKRVRFTRGLDTRAARRMMKPGVPI